MAEAGGGWTVRLDGRGLRSPGGAPLVLPLRARAAMIAREWEAQGAHLEPALMHATRLANTALDAVSASREAIAAQIVEYAGADLLCYFAEGPQGLARRQQAAWEPVLRRAEGEEGLVLTRVSGVVHRAQPPGSLQRVRDIALALDDFTLTGLASATPLFGSAILAVGVLRGWMSGEEAFELSRLDEAFQEERWGIDAEAAERAEHRRNEARVVGAWLRPGE